MGSEQSSLTRDYFTRLPSKKDKLSKKTARLLNNIPHSFTVVSEDESAFVLNMETKKIWAAEEIRPIRIVSGYHGKTIVHEVNGIDSRQFL